MILRLSTIHDNPLNLVSHTASRPEIYGLSTRKPVSLRHVDKPNVTFPNFVITWCRIVFTVQIADSYGHCHHRNTEISRYRQIVILRKILQYTNLDIRRMLVKNAILNQVRNQISSP